MQNSKSSSAIINSQYTYLIFLCLIYLIYLIFTIKLFNWVIDDLYIYFRYADNFVNGKGIVFNEGTRVEGFSSFSWFLILSTFDFLKLPLEFFSKLTGIIFALGNIFLVFKISKMLNCGKLSLLACLLSTFNLPFLIWSVSGFEIMFYSFLLLLCIYRLIIHPANNFSLIMSFLIFLVTISRPEGFISSAAFLAIIFFWNKNKTSALKIIFVFSILLGAFLFFRFNYFGDFLPNTYYAKLGNGITGSYEFSSYKKGAAYILYFFRDNPQFILPIFLIPLVYKTLKQNKFFLFILTLIILRFIFIIYSGGDWMIHYRFIVPAIPLLSIASVILIRYFAEEYHLKKIYYNAIILFLFLIIVLNLILINYNSITRETVLWNNVKNISTNIRKEIPHGELAAIGASGIIPYALNEVSFIDIVGLNDVYIAKNGFRHGNWFEKSLPEYVYGRNPDWLIMWKRKNASGKFSFENANPCYLDMSGDKNFGKYTLYKTYDASDDDRIELYKIKEKIK